MLGWWCCWLHWNNTVKMAKDRKSWRELLAALISNLNVLNTALLNVKQTYLQLTPLQTHPSWFCPSTWHLSPVIAALLLLCMAGHNYVAFAKHRSSVHQSLWNCLWQQLVFHPTDLYYLQRNKLVTNIWQKSRSNNNLSMCVWKYKETCNEWMHETPLQKKNISRKA